MNILPEESLPDAYRLFDQPCPTPHHLENASFAEPSIDVVEKPTSFEIIVDLPGVAREDISVDCHEGALTIIANVSRELQTQETDRLIHRERYQGLLKRTVTLSKHLDSKAIYARHHDGVLEIFIPKHGGNDKADYHVPVV